MSEKDQARPLPPRLTASEDRTGVSLRMYARYTAENSKVTVGLSRIKKRAKSAQPTLLTLAVAALSVAAFSVAALIYQHRTAVPGRQQAVATLAKPQDQSSVAPAHAGLAAKAQSPLPPAADSRPPSIRLTDEAVSLPSGPFELGNAASAVLSADARASARKQNENTELVLERGSIALRVSPQAPGHPLSITAAQYRFVVVGTVFTVSRAQSRLELAVEEGAVAVFRKARRVAIVAAGSTWSVDLPSVVLARPSSTPSTPPSSPPNTLDPPPAPPAMPAASPTSTSNFDCGRLVKNGRAQEALRCYQKQAAQNGLSGETAQYEIGRLWRDTFGQPERAVEAFEAQRSRFASGALRAEADLSIIELLPRIGRHQQALAESQRFLAAHPKSERQSELRLLRGNIYREALQDFEQARREYALGSESSGPAGDDSRFFYAVSLEALGRSSEARQAYGEYLSKATARSGHTMEARKRLDRMGP